MSLARLHRFFRQVSENVSHACMLGGAVEPTALNQWVMIGLHVRQEAILNENELRLNGAPHRLYSTHADALFANLEQMRQDCRNWTAEKKEHALPMGGGLMGGFGYGFYRWCDAGWESVKSAEDPEWPDMVLYEFEDWLFYHLERGEWIILTDNVERHHEYEALWASLAADEQLHKSTEAFCTPTQNADFLAKYRETFEASFPPAEFEQSVERLKMDIFNGEIYQANLSIRLQKILKLDPYALFEKLCHKNPSPFSGFFKWPDGVIVCNSPERLVRLDETGRADTRPIAGTRGRGKTPAEDEQIGQTLLSNEKELAEHMMLVDLARNDLGRVCRAGTVQVDDLLCLERYSHVTHLVSNVTGLLREDCTQWDLIRSLFPGGTITGCPKIRCVQILNAVEPVPRGFYTGSMGFLDATSQALDLNILIRSIFLKPAHDTTNEPLVYNTAVQSGGGIVHDSVGAFEARECLRKATASLNELYAAEVAENLLSV